MNIDINLLPEEVRPKPLVETRTLLLIIVIVALAAGCYYSYQAKASAGSDIADLQKRILVANQEINAVSTNAEALGLIKSIDAVRAMDTHYAAFLASRVDWGDALERAQSHVPSGVTLASLTQSGTSIVLSGTASSYGAVASYGRALDADDRFTLVAVPRFDSAGFTLTLAVTPGGAR